jgi:hypothetical protein
MFLTRPAMFPAGSGAVFDGSGVHFAMYGDVFRDVRRSFWRFWRLPGWEKDMAEGEFRTAQGDWNRA